MVGQYTTYKRKMLQCFSALLFANFSHLNTALDKFDVYCIGVTKRDGGLQPLEEYLEFTAERIGPSLELAEIEHLTLS